MALIKGDKVYRNLQEQVYENTCDIQELLRMYGYHGPYTSTDVIPADDLYNRAMYLIGTGMPYKVYQYNDLTKRFTYIGDYNMDVGPEGPPGPQGPQGEPGPAGKPASEIVNIETYDVVYKQDVTESKVRANFDDGHSNEFTVFAKNGVINDSNLIAGKGITVEYNTEDKTATIGVNNTIVDTDKLNEKLNEELPKKQDKLTPGKNISIVDNVISSTGGLDGVVGGTGITVENTADDKAIVNISSDIINKIDDLETNKQDKIEDLDTIRDGAAKGSTAVQPTDLGNYVTLDTNQTIAGKKTFNDDVDFNGAVFANKFLTLSRKFSIENNKYNKYLICDSSVINCNLYDEDNQNYIAGMSIHFIGSEDLSTPISEKIPYIGFKHYDETRNYLYFPKTSGTFARLEDIPDITPLATKEEVTAVATDLSNHTSDTIVHVTAEDKTEWSNKVSQDQIADMATKTELGNYVTTDTLNTTVSSIDNKLATKQDVISDLDTIRSGAAAGATAVQPATLDDYATKDEIPDVSIYATTDSVNAAVLDINNSLNKEVATRKSEISRVENKIPTQYVLDASVAGNLLSIIKSDGSQIQYNPTGESQMDPYVQCEYKNGQLIFTCNSLYGEKYLSISAQIYINDNAAVRWEDYTKTIDLDMTAKGWNVKVTSNVVPPGGTIYSAYIVNPTFVDDFATTDQIPTDYVALTGDQTINGKKTYTDGVTAANFTAQGNNESTIYDGTQMVHKFSDNTTLNLKYPKKSGNQTIATVGDIPDVSNMVTTDTEQTISGHKFFDEGSVDVSTSGNTAKAIRLYGSGGIGIYDSGTNNTRKAYLTLPRTNGTLALTSDIYYQNGDKFTNTGFYNANGYLTGGGKEIGFTITLPKNLKNIKTITVNKLSCNVRGIGGYLNGTGYVDYTKQTGITVNAYKATDNAVFIQIKMSNTTWGGTNNTPVAVAFAQASTLDITLNT